MPHGLDQRRVRLHLAVDLEIGSLRPDDVDGPRDAARRLSTRNLTPPDIAVEPTGLLLVVLRLAAEPLVFENDGAVDLTDVIPGFSLDVGALLAPLGPDWSPDEGEE